MVKFRIVGLSFFLLALVIAVIFIYSPEEIKSISPSHDNSVTTDPISEVPAQTETAAAEIPKETIAADKDNRRTQAIKAGWFEGFASSDAYREVAALRESKQLGTFGAGLRLLRPCAALNALRSPTSDPLSKATSSTNYQMRLKARDRLIIYCSQVPGETLVALAEPPEGDNFASQYISAINTLDTSMINSKLENRAALEELARQGQITAGKNYILGNLVLNKPSLNLSREASSAAFDIAEMRATSRLGMASKDIRLLLRCFTGGVCDDSYESLSSRFTETEQQKILSMAAEMEAAFRNGDVSALIGPP